MSTSTFFMSVPVEEFEITDGPSLKILLRSEGSYEPSMGESITLTLKTPASKRTFVRRGTAYYFAELKDGKCVFSVAISGSVYRCHYCYTTRTGRGTAYYTDDLDRYYREEAAR